MRLPLKQYYHLLSTYLRPQRVHVLWMAVLLLANIALQLINPQIMRFFIDAGLADGELSLLLRAAVLFIVIAFGSQAFAVGATYFAERVAWTATNALRTDLVEHCLGLDLVFHKTHTPGEIIERIDGDVNMLSNFFSRFTIHIVGSGITLVGVLALLFREDWRIGFGMTLFAVAGIAILMRIRTIAIPFWHERRRISAEFYGFLGEHLTATEDLRANGATGYVMQRFHALLRRWLPIRVRADLAGYAMWMSTAAIFGIGTIIPLALGAYGWHQGILTIGGVYLVYNYAALLRGPMQRIREQITDLQQADAGIARIRTLLETESRLSSGGDSQLASGPLSVQCEEISFSYEDQPDETVLDSVTFHLQPGRVMGLLGRTGSGKSTLGRLLLRLYDPTSGRLRVGGVDPKEVPLHSYRQRVGMVTQDVQLFHATVRDNVTFFNPAIDDSHILAVLSDLGLEKWLAGLPNGLDTLLAGSEGVSAGQAQLLAFARIFLTDPGLIILDEASSRLDPATEQLIEHAIDKLCTERTAILIAHRLATVQRADEILILEKGHVAEYGERARLTADATSRFARLLQTGMEEVLV